MVTFADLLTAAREAAVYGSPGRLAALRRTLADYEASLTFPHWYDSESRKIQSEKGTVPLTKQQSRVLVALLHGGGELVPYQRLIDALIGDDIEGPSAPDKVLRVVITRLRRALEAADISARILNNRGVGYAICQIGTETCASEAGESRRFLSRKLAPASTTSGHFSEESKELEHISDRASHIER